MLKKKVAQKLFVSILIVLSSCASPRVRPMAFDAKWPLFLDSHGVRHYGLTLEELLVLDKILIQCGTIESYGNP